MDVKITKKLDAFFSHYPKKTVDKGEIIIRAGSEPSGIFYLKKGHVRQYFPTSGGEELTLTIFKPLSFFPMSWAVNTYSNSCSFEAIDECEIRIAPKDKVVIFIKREPDVLFDLVQRVYSGLEGVLSRMEYLMSGDAYARLIALLVNSAKRFGQNNKQSVVITIKFTHQELANQTGLSRETVSRMMRALKKRGFVDYIHTTIHIPNIDILKQELSA